MRIVPLPTHSLRAGVPLPFSVRGARGQLLAARGRVIASETGIDALAAGGLWVDADEVEAYQRSYRDRLEALQRQNAAAKRPMPATPQANDDTAYTPPDWPVLLLRATALLHDAAPKNFCERVSSLRRDIVCHLQRNPDRALLVLVHSAALDLAHYSAWHALLVTAVCELAAAHVPAFRPEPVRAALGCAALTMNISMSGLHNRLASQREAPSAAQRAQISGHAGASSRLLLELGVADPLWLQAVSHHHDRVSGPLDARPLGEQLGRMIQRADVFAARLSPRANRPAMSPVEAAQAAYLDEHRQPDPAGVALIKAIGIYPPGALVALASAEVAVVLRRGAKANQPVTAAVLSSAGSPTEAPLLRDTSQPALAVTRSLASHEVKLAVSLEALLGLY